MIEIESDLNQIDCDLTKACLLRLEEVTEDKSLVAIFKNTEREFLSYFFIPKPVIKFYADTFRLFFKC